LTFAFAKVTDEELKQVEDFVNTREFKEQLPLIERRDIPFSASCSKKNYETLLVKYAGIQFVRLNLALAWRLYWRNSR
jgi:hypothetical protein